MELYSLRGVGNQLLEKGKVEEGIKILKKALQLAQVLGHDPVVEELYEQLAYAYDIVNNLPLALTYLERAKLLKGYIINESRISSLADLEVKYQVSEKEKVLVIVERENLLKNQKLISAENENLKKNQLLTIVKSEKLEKEQELILVENARLEISKRLAVANNQKLKQEQQLTILENDNLIKEKQIVKNRFAIVILILFTIISSLIYSILQQRRRISLIEAKREIERLQQEKQIENLRSFFKGQEKERTRIANDLHDSLGGLLYGLQLRLGNYPKLSKITEAAIEENRRIMQNLMPATLMKFGLEVALEEWVEIFKKHWNLSVVSKVNLSKRYASDVEVSIYRIVQELLTNVARHAEATITHFILFQSENKIQLIVKDNGKGISKNDMTGTFLKTVYSRSQLLNGKTIIKKTDKNGTKIVVEIPLKNN